MKGRALIVSGVVLALAGTTPAAFAAPLPNLPLGPQCLPPPQASATTTPWAQRQLAPQRVWPVTRGDGVTVAVVDTGVDGASSQLAGRVLAGRDARDQRGQRADSDCFGHGTFVAGIIGAAPVAGTVFAGVAPGATILPVRVADNATDASAAVLAQGIRAAVDAGARVINVSASTSTRDAGIDAAVAYAGAHDVLIVASAGNSAENGNPVPYPAADASVLAVGAVDATGKHAEFSQTGPYLGLSAPGVDVSSIGPGGPGQWQASGTSYAAPFVSGVAALVRAYHPRLTAPQVLHRLEATADRPPAEVPDPQYGWGTVNPLAAVTAVLPEEGPVGAVRTATAAAAASPVRSASDSVSGVLVALALLGASALVVVVLFVIRLGPAGARRRWAPARRLETVPDPPR